MKSRHRRPWFAGVLFVAAIMAAFVAPVRAEETSDTIRLVVGAARTIELGENPSTGYGWRLNESMSRNLALVSVNDAGFVPRPTDRPLVGAPGMRRYRITARGPGTAVAVFDYVRPWERVAPARRHTLTIEIGGR